MTEEMGKKSKEAGQAEAVLNDVKTILKPNGCLAVLEFKKTDGDFPVHLPVLSFLCVIGLC